jgi:hypothetical protein
LPQSTHGRYISLITSIGTNMAACWSADDGLTSLLRAGLSRLPTDGQMRSSYPTD